MPYCTAAEVQARFPQVAAADWGVGVLPSSAEITDMIAEADALIDDYCRSWYVVPFTDQAGYTTPDTIAETSRELVVCAVRDRIYGQSPTEDRQSSSRRSELIRRLERIGRGWSPVLDWPLNAGSATPGGPPIASEPKERHFTSDQVF